ncbi:hypothetical protein ABT337_14590 [Saccharopolyspora hirsuta]|uniref:ABC transporter n=1 Tax=Saccharopolyspora hirsuta TaxID=1837 RepID=A0A5M7C756_SACHI|nr:hypothetical protein [Saccharopolyspora hirsuta]KAA5836267.1 hypothetical protein F1721_08120 [Saccharopolyspora hirsuta]
MIALIRYRLAELGHSQRYLPPVLLYIGLLAVLHSDNAGPALPSYAVTAAALLVVAAWLTIALVDVEDVVQRTVTRAHVGSVHRMLVGTVLTVLCCAGGLAVLTTAWSQVSSGFAHPAADLAIGLLAHVVCAAFGIAVALPCSGLVVRRIGYTAIAAAALLAITLLAERLPLAHPLLLGLSSASAPPALLIQSTLTAAGLLAASTVLVAAWVVRRG